MAKKVKKKTRHASGHKEKRSPSSGASKRVDSAKKLFVEREKLGFAEMKSCKHANKGIDLEKLSARIGKFGRVRCQDCRNATERRDRKGKNKQGRGKGSVQESGGFDCIYICVACGHLSCGQSDPSSNASHAYRHWHLAHHPYAVQWDNPVSCWCFECSMYVMEDAKEVGEGSDECGKSNGTVSEVLRLIKEHSAKDRQADVEQVLFDNNAKHDDMRLEIHENLVSEGKEGQFGDIYVVKGLINLGNTCFFNSVMQNLLALETLRDYFMNVSMSNAGPLSLAIKKLFHETSINVVDKEHRESNYGSRTSGSINPKSLFNCICSKAPQFRGYQQQDSHELLRYLLDGLNIEDLVVKKSSGSEGEGEEIKSCDSAETFVDRIFGGQLSSTVSCLECGHSSVVYEPFLDLSLPVPMKRCPSKKATVAPPTKPPSKVGNFSRGQRARGKGTTVASPRPINISAPSIKPSEVSSSLCSSMPISVETTVQDEEFSWMDYVGPTVVSDDSSCHANFDVSEDRTNNYGCSASSAAREDSFMPAKERSAYCYEKGSVLEHVHQSSQLNSADGTALQVENNSSYQFEPKTAGTNRLPEECTSDGCCPKKQQLLDYESSSESRIIDEFPLLVQDSEVLLLPYKEVGSSLIEGSKPKVDLPISTCQAYDDVPLKELNIETSSVVDYEEMDADFYGFGDLFNEPEPVESGLASESLQPNQETGMQDLLEMETILLAGNSSESNQEEVDDTNCPVSVDVCLTDFFKPELLSEEHAWNCENCSKIVNCQNQFDGCQEQPIVLESGAMLSNSQEDGDEFRIEKLQTVSNQNNVAASANVLQCNDVVIDQESISEALFTEACKDTDHGQPNNSFDENLCGSEQLVATCQNVGRASKKKYRVSGKLPKSKGKKTNLTGCETVVMKRDATKRFLINKAPPVLTVHLKRFTQDAHGRLSKLSGHINFQLVLDLRPYMDPRCKDKNCIYHLVGVVEHSGTMRSGHYVAYVRGQRNRNPSTVSKDVQSTRSWYYVSDNYVRELSLREVLQSEAYILFYERLEM